MSELKQDERDAVTIGEIRSNNMVVIDAKLFQLARCVKDLRMKDAQEYLSEIEKYVLKLQELNGFADSALMCRPTKVV